MADLTMSITHVAIGSEFVLIYPNAAVTIYAAGTTTPAIWQGSADANGVISITSLDAGAYDLYVDGQKRHTFQYVPADYATKHARSFAIHFAGTISADAEQHEDRPTFAIDQAGKIIGVRINAQYLDATADCTIHLVSGAAARGAALTFAADSVWSVQANPQQETYDWQHVEPAANLAISAGQVVSAAIDYVAGSVKGITVEILFKED